MKEIKIKILGFVLLLAPWVLFGQKEATIDKSVVTVFGGAKQTVPLRLTERKFFPMKAVRLPLESFELNFEEQGAWPLQK